MIYYVSTKGNDFAKGTIDEPFRTINHAAQIAAAGDTVKVFGGTYREWVSPLNGGVSDHNRIVYEPVEGEKAIIKGSEIITGWEKVEGTVWKKTLPNEMFGEWNPYATELNGDWLEEPYFEYRIHLGDVYINGVSMFEAKSKEDLYDNTPRIKCCMNRWYIREELILHPELTIYKWYAEVDETTTTIYCNFQNYNPNEELIEINVRQCCFYPKATGVNYITLKGFEICHAACPWAPPSGNQIGMVGPHWSMGWIIENNDIHDAKCSAVSLGKEALTGDNLYTKFDRKSAHRHQLEAVFKAIQLGWSKDTVGSHVVRNNVIHDCGQNAVVGHMGCVFSTIEHNHIYNIGVKHEFFGHEMAGIKFHGAVDTVIRHNNIHNCTLGTWLDWQTQGCRVTGNLYHSNNRDLMIEVSHGPYVVDNNILLSDYAFDNWSQGGAMVHNLIAGKINNAPVIERSTPYHFPHTTMVAGYCEIYGGDDRYYNNMFAGLCGDNEDDFSKLDVGSELKQFTKVCDKYSDPEEYAKIIASQPKAQWAKFMNTPQPVWIKDNAYSGFAEPSVHEKNGFEAKGLGVELSEADGKWILKLDVPEEFAKAECEKVTTARLGEPRIAAMAFEASDGSELDFGYDVTGSRREGTLNPGPVSNLKAGKQEIVVWEA